MFDTLAILPAEFWNVIALIATGYFWGTKNIRRGIGIPVTVVVTTILVWYVGDVLYNDYRENHMWLF